MAKDDRRKFHDFRKHHEPRTRRSDWTREFQDQIDESSSTERVSGKGEVTRKRTVIGARTGDEHTGEVLGGSGGGRSGVPPRTGAERARRDEFVCTEQDEQYRCATRRLLKTLSTDQRHVVAAGDRVQFRPAAEQRGDHRTDRAAARGAQPHQPRPAARARGQRGPVADRDQRGRAAAQAAPDRPVPGDGRKGPRPAARLHQQDRPGRAGRPAAAGRRLRPDGLPGAVAVGRDRIRHRRLAARWPAARAWWPGRAAWASRRC